MKPLLSLRDITKSFPGVLALDKVSLTVDAGSVHALMGENGAGKSTLMKCLFGVYEKDGGEIFFEGERVNFRNSKDALLGGVAMVHQELNQALDLSVAENIWLGRFPKKYGLFISDKEMNARSFEIFRELGITEDPRAKMKTLSVSHRQMVEIAKAVSYGSKIIVFDEPTSSLSETEAEKLFEIIEKLKSRGCGIIYISHKMEEILRISDKVSIMRDGKLITTRDAESLTTEEIIKLMVGRELEKRYPEKTAEIGGVLLSVDSLSGERIPQNVSFSLRRGEILGIAGLEGSGRTELLECLFGLREKTGEILKSGERIENRTPREAMKNGFALITEERRKSGIFSILSLTENTTISSLKKYGKWAFVSRRRQEAATDECIKSMRVKTPNQKTKIESLSGGNQQKIILGRWLLREPEILLLDEPTRGIDVGAKYEIYKLITELAKEGHGIIVVSSEMPELLGISDRILVMSAGRVAGELATSDATQEKIMTLASKFL